MELWQSGQRWQNGQRRQQCRPARIWPPTCSRSRPLRGGSRQGGIDSWFQGRHQPVGLSMDWRCRHPCPSWTGLRLCPNTSAREQTIQVGSQTMQMAWEAMVEICNRVCSWGWKVMLEQDQWLPWEDLDCVGLFGVRWRPPPVKCCIWRWQYHLGNAALGSVTGSIWDGADGRSGWQHRDAYCAVDDPSIVVRSIWSGAHGGSCWQQSVMDKTRRGTSGRQRRHSHRFNLIPV